MKGRSQKDSDDARGKEIRRKKQRKSDEAPWTLVVSSLSVTSLPKPLFILTSASGVESLSLRAFSLRFSPFHAGGARVCRLDWKTRLICRADIDSVVVLAMVARIHGIYPSVRSFFSLPC